MEGADALTVIAEVGIGIVGFTGIVVALRAHGGEMVFYTRIRVAALLFFSGSTAILALVPFAFAFAGFANATIWSLSSWIAVLVHATGLTVILRAAFARAEPVASGPALWLRNFGMYVTPFMYVLLTANAVWLQQLWPFYTYLLFTLALGLVQFGVTLLLSGPTEISGDQNA